MFSNYLQQAYLVKMDVLGKEKVCRAKLLPDTMPTKLTSLQMRDECQSPPPPQKNLHQWLGSQTMPIINFYILNNLFIPNNLQPAKYGT